MHPRVCKCQIQASNLQDTSSTLIRTRMTQLKEELFQEIGRNDLVLEFIQEDGFDCMGVFDLDNDDNYWCNEKFWSTLGYPEMDNERPKYRSLLGQADQIIEEDLRHQLINDDLKFFETYVRFSHATGQKIAMKCRGMAIQKVMGRPSKLLVLFRLKKKLPEFDLNQTIIENSPNAIAVLDKEMRYIAYSKKWLQEYDLVGQNLVGKSHYEVFPEISDEWKLIHEECLLGQYRNKHGDIFVRQDGSRQWLDWKISPWYLSPLEVGGLVFFTRDITKEESTRLALEKSKLLYSAVVNVNPDMIFRINKDGEITFFHSNDLEQLYASSDQFMGQQIEDILPTKIARKTYTTMESTLVSGKEKSFKYQLSDKGGESWFEARMIPANEKEVLCLIRDITEQEVSQLQSKRLEKMLQNAEEIARVGGWEYDIEKDDILWTDQVYKIHEIEKSHNPEVSTGLNFYHFADRYKIETALNNVIELGEPFDLRLRFITAKNNLLWVRVTAQAVFKGDRPSKIMGVIQDITQVERDKETIRKEQNFSKNLLKSIADGFVIISQDGQHVDINEAFCEMTGFERSDLIGQFPPYPYWPLDKKVLLNSFFQEDSPYESGNADFTLIKKDGSPLPVIISYSVVRDENKKIVNYFAIIKDISERKRAEEEVARSKQLLEAYINANSDIISLKDKDDRYTWVNDAFCSFFGLDKEKILGRTDLQLFDKLTAEKLQPTDQYKLAFERTGSLTIEYTILGRILEYTFFRVDLGEEEGNVGTIARDITEKKIAEKALRYERDLFSEGPVFTLEWGATAGFPVLYVSQNVEKIIGYSADEFMSSGFTYFDHIHPEDQPRIKKETEEFKREQRFHYEQSYRFLTKDGSYRWMYDFTMIMKDPWSGEKLIRGYLFDYTWFKEIEAALIEEKSKLAAIINGTNAGTWEWKIPSGSIQINDKWANHLGYRLQELDSLTITQLEEQIIHPEDLPSIKEAIRQHFSGARDFFNHELRMLHKEGHYIWTHLRGQVAVRDTEGNPQIAFGTQQVITERKLAEEATKASRDQFESLVDHMPGIIFRSLADEDWSMLYISDQVEIITGYPASDFRGGGRRSFESIIHIEDRDSIRQLVMDAIAEKKSWEVKYRLIHKDGTTRWVNEKANAVYDSEGQIVCIDGFIQDVTEQKFAARELETTKRLLEQTNTVARVGGWEYDIESGTILWTSTIKEIFEVEPGFEPTPESIYNFFTADSQRQLDEVYETSIKQAGNYDLELQINTAKERIIWVRVIVNVHFEKGTCVRLFGTLQDIHSQKINEIELESSRLNYAQLVSQIPIGIYKYREDDVFTYVSPVWEQLLGISAEDVLRDSSFAFDAILDLDREAVTQKNIKAIADRTALDIEIRYLVHGKVKWMHLVSKPYLGEDGFWYWFGSISDITQEKEAELEYKSVQKLLDLFFDQSLIGFSIMTLDKGVVWNDDIDKEKVLDYVFEHMKMTKTNQAMAAQYGATVEEIVGLNANELFAYNLEYGRKLCRELFDKGALHNETEEQKLDGTPIVIEGYSVCLYDEQGNVTGFFGVQQDITAKKHAKLALEQYSQYLQTIIDSVPSFIFVKDFEGRYLLANAAVGKYLGLDGQPVIGKTDIELGFMDKVARMYLEQDQEVLRTNKPLFIPEEKIIEADGTARWFQTTKIPFTQYGSETRTVLAVAVDITYRKSIEDELLQTKQMLENIFSELSDVIWSLDPRSKSMLFVSPSAKDLLGLDVTSLLEDSSKMEELIHPEDKPKLKKINDRIKKNGQHEEEYRVITQNGQEKWVLHKGKAIADSEGNILRIDGHLTDISTRKKYELKIKSLLEVTKEQNERLKNFAHIVSHNIRSHSSNFSALLELLLHEKEDLKNDQMFQMLNTASENLKDTIEHLNEVVSINTTVHDNLVRLNLRDAIQEAASSISMLATKSNVRIINDVTDDFQVLGIKAYLDSIILNLMTNGIKYRSQDKDSYIKLSVSKSNDHTILSVEDNGVGIDLIRNRKKIFGLFKTFHGNEDARGVGLFITKNQVEAMGGKITVDSEIGKGTVFQVHFPDDPV